MRHLDLWNALLGVVVGYALSLLWRAFRLSRRRWATRRLRSFWQPFMGNELTIVVTEYPAGGSGSETAIARVAGGGWLISKGMALALSEIRGFAHRCLRAPDISTLGDHSSGSVPSTHVVIGSEASNSAAIAAMRVVRENFDVPFEVRWNAEERIVEIVLRGVETPLQPRTTDDVGHDYGLVLKATLPGPPSGTVVLVSGCHMWGSYAAARALVDEDMLHRVAELSHHDDNVAFIVRTQVVYGSARSPELQFEGKCYVMPLQPKRSGITGVSRTP